MKSKVRNSNIELLRIIAMLMIVFHHFIVHGVTMDAPCLVKFYENNIVSEIIASGGKIGVDLFILITSYFLINSTFNYSKIKNRLKNIVIPVWFYSILFLIIAVMLHQKIEIKSIIQSIFPILFVNYWFITDYIILFILSSFFNITLDRITQKQHFILMILLILIVSFCPTFLYGALKDTGAVNVLMIFFSLYVTGTYIRKYPMKCEKKLGIILISIGTLVLFSSFIIFNLLAYKINNVKIYAYSAYLASDTSFIIYIIALGLFLWGKNFNLKHSKIINVIAGTTLGIYLIHDNPFMRKWIWNDVLHLPNLIYGSWINIIILALIICPIYFLICSGIEYLRQKLFQKLIN